MAYFSDVDSIERFDTGYFHFKRNIHGVISSHKGIKLTGSLSKSCFSLLRSGTSTIVVSDIDLLNYSGKSIDILPKITQLSIELMEQIPGLHGSGPKVTFKDIHPETNYLEDIVFSHNGTVGSFCRQYDTLVNLSDIEKLGYLHLIAKLLFTQRTSPITIKIYYLSKSLRPASDVLSKGANDALLQYEERHLTVYIANNLAKLSDYFGIFLKPKELNCLMVYLRKITKKEKSLPEVPSFYSDIINSTYSYVRTEYPKTRVMEIFKSAASTTDGER